MAFNNKEELKSKAHSQDFIPSFIRKTYDILEEARFPQYIDWSADGTAIVIKKPSEFSQKVLPVYFKHNNFTSFVRQLNMYNFHKRRTQSLDHVYVHELFQRGKRHLLQEIKRKSHEHTGEKTPKILEVQEPVKTPGDDLSSLAKENQFFKRLYTEAMNRLAVLERQAKELAIQNQSLWAQVHQKNEREKAYKPFIGRFDSQSELTLDQLPMTLGKMPLNLNSGYKAQVQMNRAFPQKTGQLMRATPTSNNSNDFTSIGEESSGASTEVSRSSPNLTSSEQESEEAYDNSRFLTQKKNNIPMCPQVPQVQSLRICNELSISRQEMSAGQMFAAWNFELENDDVLCFADQKADNKPSVNMQAAMFQEKSLIGKRQFEAENQHEALEPTMKRHELCIFNRKGMISNGMDDKDMVGTAMYFGNPSLVNGSYELSMGIDLMDF